MTADLWVFAADHRAVAWPRIADNCQWCLTERSTDVAVVPMLARQVGDEITAMYGCPDCHRTWTVGWHAPWVGFTLPSRCAGPASLPDLIDRAIRRVRDITDRRGGLA